MACMCHFKFCMGGRTDFAAEADLSWSAGAKFGNYASHFVFECFLN